LSQQQGHKEEIEISDQSGEPFTAVWNWFLDREDLTVADKLVWIALKSYAGYREVRPSVKTVAKRASVSVRTAQRSFDVLSKIGLLRVERRNRPDGGFATNRYILLAAPRKNMGKGVGDTVSPTPGVTVTPAPGATLSPPLVTQCHQINIKRIKDKKTSPLTPLSPEKPESQPAPGQIVHPGPPDSAAKPPEPVVGIDDIKRLIAGTQFRKLTDQALLSLTREHGCKRIFDVLDVLVAIYKPRKKRVEDPGAVLRTALSRGVTPPHDYVPYHERIEKERKAKEEEEKKRMATEEKAKAEEEAFRKICDKFDALPDEEREQWMEKARATMHPNFRGAKIALRSIALSLFRGG
jgi:Helix-turn-helix domain